MKSKIRHIPLEKLIPHPDNPNRMSRANFGKLMRHIKRNEYYEPLVVRRHPTEAGCFQIINGHHRCAALKKLGHQTAQAVVWDVDDEQADILLTTLNRLGGRDILEKKLEILRRLSSRRSARELAKLLPQTKGQLERLTVPQSLTTTIRPKANVFAKPLVFFVSSAQEKAIEQALSTASVDPEATTRATRRAAALTQVAQASIETRAPATPGPE